MNCGFESVQFDSTGIISIVSSKQSVTDLIIPIFDGVIEYIASKKGHEDILPIHIISDTKNIPFSYLLEKLSKINNTLDSNQQDILQRINFSQCFDIQGISQTITEITSYDNLFSAIIVLNLKEMLNTSTLSDGSKNTCVLLNKMLLMIRRSLTKLKEGRVYFLNREHNTTDTWLLDYYIDQKIVC